MALPISAPTEPVPAWAQAMLVERSRRRTATAQAAAFDTDAPPVELRGEDLEYWNGQRWETKAGGERDRSRSLWRLAVILLAAGCSPAFTEHLLAERDVALGWTKFVGRTDTAERYRVIVQRALATKAPREAHVRKKPPPPPLTTDLFMTAAELAELEDENLHWFVFGWLAKGLVSELDGKAKQAGKTTLVLVMVRAILEGLPFLGLETQYSPVVYLSEQSGPSLKPNLEKAGLLGHKDLHILLWNRVAGQKWSDVVMLARQKCREVGASVLVVDTLAQFSGVRGDQENSSGAALETMEPIQAATADGLAVLVNRHDRKSGGDVGDSGRGSSAYAGAVDIILHLQRVPAGERQDRQRQRLLDGISRFQETPDQLVIELNPEVPHEYTLVGDQKEVRNATLRVEVLAILPLEAATAPTFDELRKEIGCRELVLRGVLRDLVKEDLVERFDRPIRYFQKPSRYTDE